MYFIVLLCQVDSILKVKMQNSLFKFRHFPFQSSKFVFVHFSPLSFKTPQFNPLLECRFLLLLSPQNDVILD